MKRVSACILFSALIVVLTAPGKSAPSLSAYVGKYPVDKVAGTSLFDHPQFRTLVSDASPNMSIRATILNKDVVQTPVGRQGALIVVRMCEPHRCSTHQWTVAILSPSGPAAICYHTSALMDEQARWFIGGASVSQTRGCWKGNHTDVPDTVAARLTKGR
jgi:hypothetical protein